MYLFVRFLVLVLILLTSCIPARHTSYRVLNRNGKVVYFEDKKTPIYNNNIKNNKEEMQEITNITKKAKQQNQTTSKIPDDLVLDSSAYTLRSVVDTIVKDDDIEKLAKSLEKTKKPKTISDFNIPEYYFNSNVPTREELEKNKQQIIEINQQKKNNGFFAKIASWFKGDNDIKPVNNTEEKYILNNTTATNSTTINKPIFNKNQKTGKSQNKYTGNDNELVVKSRTKTSNQKNYTLTTSKTNNTPKTQLEKGKFYIQLGAFKDKKNATKLLDKFNDVGTYHKAIENNTKNGNIYKVVIGTFNSKAEAEKEMEKILDRGHFDCYVFKN